MVSEMNINWDFRLPFDVCFVESFPFLWVNMYFIVSRKLRGNKFYSRGIISKLIKSCFQNSRIIFHAIFNNIYSTSPGDTFVFNLINYDDFIH